MKTHRIIALVAGVILYTSGSASAKTITVTTTDNISPGPGETNLVQAIQLLQDGDTIAFNIPGTGPFYLTTPPLTPDNGYPSITNNNITIDGYSQPSAIANTNTILGSNTAQIQIVLDSRAGGLHAEDINGYGTSEASILLFKAATNITLRGLVFLGPGEGSSTEDDPASYGVSLAQGSKYAHINGCWFGLAPDGSTVGRFESAITGFQGIDYASGATIGINKTAPNSATARAQFNVILGAYIPIILEGFDFRISGNFINVYPTGTNDYLSDGSTDHDLQAFMEFGGSAANLIIGTDGDGTNDAEERNIFGGVTLCDDFNLFEWYGDPNNTNMVIAGNYFGVGVDGITRFTNSMTMISGPHGGLHDQATLRIGSDFNGVSDALEGNLISMNYPFDFLFPPPDYLGVYYDFSEVRSGAIISFRGNTVMGAMLMPFTYADGTGADLPRLAAYCSNYIAAPYFPTLATNSTQAILRGTVPAGVGAYTNILIDLYLGDNEAWTNGQKFQFEELAYTDPSTSDTAYYGFSEGHTWLGMFDPNSITNLDSTPGQFAFDVTGLNLPANTLLTVTASYGTTNHAPLHTSPFSLPLLLPPLPPLAIKLIGTNLLLDWPTNSGLYTVQSTVALAAPMWTNVAPPPLIQTNGTNFEATVPVPTDTTFYRLIH